MKKIGIVVYLILIGEFAFPQKKVVDFTAFDNWPRVEKPSLTNDGKYCFYSIVNKSNGMQTLVIRDTKGSFQGEFYGVKAAKFTGDNSKLIFEGKDDSLGIMNLKTKTIGFRSRVKSFKIPKEGGAWIAYELRLPESEIVLENMITGKSSKIKNVWNFEFDDEGRYLVVQTSEKRNDSTFVFINLINLLEDSVCQIWSSYELEREGFKISNLILSDRGRLAFVVERKSKQDLIHDLYYYEPGYLQAACLTKLQQKQPEIVVDGNRNMKILDNGLLFYAYYNDIEQRRTFPLDAKVDIWSYDDVKLQARQLNELAKRSYLTILNKRDGNLFRIENENEQVLLTSFQRFNGHSNYLLVIQRKGDEHEWRWNDEARPSVLLVSTKNANRKVIREKVFENSFTALSLSPDEKYVVYYDSDQSNYFSYEISTGKVRNITKKVATIWTLMEINDRPISKYMAAGIAGWIDSSTVLLYDQNDIWQVDVSTKTTPYVVTNNYGGKNQVCFRLAVEDQSHFIGSNGKLILCAFDRVNKNNGFFSKQLGVKGDPKPLSMGPWLSHMPLVFHFPPIKARDAQVFLVRRMSAKQSPNYFSTTDFKSFIPLSDVHPENGYNWLSSKLINLNSADGTATQGIFYLPENFDSTRKYPVIITFYEKLSQGLYEYHAPSPSVGPINIPYFVSNDFLIFAIDINFKIGRPGESSYNSVSVASNYLKTCPWVNGEKIAIYGHSWGGYQVGYLVTRSNLFAGAVSASGLFDFVSYYGSVIRNGISTQSYLFENGQCRLDSTLWENQEMYIENSPIFNASEIKTPILMLCNKADNNGLFHQGIEFYTALRRLGKRSWMLQYDDGGHILSRKTDMIDYTIRLTQFFNHYLKSAPAPSWMTQGITARLKGVITGYDLDPSGNCGKDCKVCNMWNEKFKKDSAATWQQIRKEGKNQWMGLLHSVSACKPIKKGEKRSLAN